MENIPALVVSLKWKNFPAFMVSLEGKKCCVDGVTERKSAAVLLVPVWGGLICIYVSGIKGEGSWTALWGACKEKNLGGSEGGKLNVLLQIFGNFNWRLTLPACEWALRPYLQLWLVGGFTMSLGYKGNHMGLWTSCSCDALHSGENYHPVTISGQYCWLNVTHLSSVSVNESWHNPQWDLV